jgi:hypothetical protein
MIKISRRCSFTINKLDKEIQKQIFLCSEVLIDRSQKKLISSYLYSQLKVQKKMKITFKEYLISIIKIKNQPVRMVDVGKTRRESCS